MRKEPSHWYLGDVRGIIYIRDLAQPASPACQEIEFLPIFGVNNSNSWDEGSIFTLSFALIWGPVVVLCSVSPSSAKLFKNCHESALCSEALFLPSAGCKQRPERPERNWQKTCTGQSLKTPISCSYWLPSVARAVADCLLQEYSHEYAACKSDIVRYLVFS